MADNLSPDNLRRSLGRSCDSVTFEYQMSMSTSISVKDVANHSNEGASNEGASNGLRFPVDEKNNLSEKGLPRALLHEAVLSAYSSWIGMIHIQTKLPGGCSRVIRLLIILKQHPSQSPCDTHTHTYLVGGFNSRKNKNESQYGSTIPSKA